MSAETDSLQELYREVTDETVLTESQEEVSSRDPVEEEDVALRRDASAVAVNDGLEDALEGVEPTAELDTGT
jgi:hypothetical protein